jgi:glyoxylase-like metal-dependent hydrolase (beta-lactamase superfamily II)
MDRLDLGSASRRTFLKTASLFAGATALAGTFPARLLAQTDEERLAGMRKQISGPIKVTPAGDNVSMISGAGGNIGVFTGPEGKVVVDTGVVTSADDVLKALGGTDGQPLKYVVNTHWHYDHTEGNEKLHRAGATVVAHAKTRERLTTAQYIDALKLHIPAAPTGGLPTRTLTDEFTFYHNGDEVLLQHVPPAHTDTDLFVVFTKANVIHGGDLFFNGVYPVIDYSTGGAVNGMVDALARISTVANDNTKIIPGHGPLGSKTELVQAHDMLATVRDRVAAAKKSGKTLEETVAAKPTADLDGVWGKWYVNGDMMVTLVYKTL